MIAIIKPAEGVLGDHVIRLRYFSFRFARANRGGRPSLHLHSAHVAARRHRA
jgi:hypothetical protein